MAMFDSIFAGSNGVASILLNTMGVSGVKLIRKSFEYNPRTDTTTETVMERDTTTSPPLKYKASEISALGVGKDDCKIIGKGDDYYDVVDKTDQILFQGDLFTVISHQHIYSGSKIACTVMQVRKQSEV